MSLREYRLRFRLFPFLLLAVPIPLFMYLGFWQLDRAEQKRELAATLEQRSHLPPVAITGMSTDSEQLRWRNVTARGEFEPAGRVFIENRMYAGRNGFHVITPLRLAGSDVRVLVNQGWVAADRALGIPQLPTPSRAVEVSGRVDVPAAPALLLHQTPDMAAAWGNRWPFLTVQLFAERAGYPVVPFVILQSPGDAEGFLRNWPKDMPKEGMHLGYAIQWFAFAAIAASIFLRLSVERRGGAREAA
jgi:surfeit locus 1 family protein